MSNTNSNIPDGNELVLNENANNANSNVDDDNISHQSDNSELPITFLVIFVKSFDGNRDELSSFIADCNKAFLLASNTQKYIV